MFDVMKEFVQNEDIPVLGYCWVPIPERSKRFIAKDYGDEYQDAVLWLLVQHVDEDIDKDPVITIWLCDKDEVSFNDTPFMEHNGTVCQFARDIKDAYEGELY